LVDECDDTQPKVDEQSSTQYEDQIEPVVINDSDERTKILLDEANISFDRFISNIDKINSKILALFQIFLVIVTIQITLIGFGDKSNFSCVNYVLLSWILVLAIFTFIYFSYLIWPKTYEHVEIFNEDRFNELCSVTKSDLLSDFLYQTRKAHLANIENYKKLSFGLKISIILVFLNLVTFSIFTITYLLK
jgi:hypothetical protein